MHASVTQASLRELRKPGPGGSQFDTEGRRGGEDWGPWGFIFKSHTLLQEKKYIESNPPCPPCPGETVSLLLLGLTLLGSRPEQCKFLCNPGGATAVVRTQTQSRKRSGGTTGHLKHVCIVSLERSWSMSSCRPCCMERGDLTVNIGTGATRFTEHQKGSPNSELARQEKRENPAPQGADFASKRKNPIFYHKKENGRGRPPGELEFSPAPKL